MDLQLAGKRAIVTGGSQGIGLAVAKALAAEGADVALIARSQPRLDEAAAAVAKLGHRVLAISTDTTDDTAVRETVARVVAEWGGVDILVNAAAKAASPGPAPKLADLVDDDLHFEVDTKVLGYLRMARAVAPHMTEQGWGRIVNVAGLALRRTGSTLGTIRNVAVAAMTKNLADELGPKGITTEQAEAKLAEGTTIGRLVTAEEVANVVTFLASPLSAAINGDSIPVGGGVPGPIYY